MGNHYSALTDLGRKFEFWGIENYFNRTISFDIIYGHQK